MIRRLSFIFMIATILHMPFMQAESFELYNKLPRAVEYALGSKENPPHENSQFTVVAPGKKSKQETVNNKEKPVMLIREKDKPRIMSYYAFITNPGKKIFIRIVDNGKMLAVEPQSFVFNSLTRDDIILIKDMGAFRSRLDYLHEYDRARRKDPSPYQKMKETSDAFHAEMQKK